MLNVFLVSINIMRLNSCISFSIQVMTFYWFLLISFTTLTLEMTLTTISLNKSFAFFFQETFRA